MQTYLQSKTEVKLACCYNVVGALQDQYKVLGEHVQQTKLEHIKSQLAIFKSSLEEFAIKHRYRESHLCIDCTATGTVASDSEHQSSLCGAATKHGVHLPQSCLSSRTLNAAVQQHVETFAMLWLQE